MRDPRFFTITHGRVLPHAIDTAEDVFAVAKVLLEESRFWQRGVRLVGLSLQLLVRSDTARQLRFTFEARADLKSPVVDRIRSKYGEHAIGLARSLEAGRRLRHAGGNPSFRPPEVE